MNRGGRANASIGVVLLCAAGWMLFTGQVIARPPSMSTRENSPTPFWLEIGSFVAFGLLLFAHGTAQFLGFASSFVARTNELAVRLSSKVLPWKAK